MKWLVYSNRAEVVMKLLGRITVINFIIFTFIAFCLGGAAMSGYVKDGHYFLSLGGHTHTSTETTKAVWLYSYYHGISLFALIFSLLLVQGIFHVTGDIKASASSSN